MKRWYMYWRIVHVDRRYLLAFAFAHKITFVHDYDEIDDEVHVLIRIRQLKIERKRNCTTSCLSKTKEVKLTENI